MVDTGDFFFRAGPVGCLLIHGFTGTPYEMRYLGERLRDAGHSVRGVRLPGHATLGNDLYQAGWRDWYAAALNGLEDLDRACSQVAVVGLSMGALLALRLAAERRDDVSRVAVLGSAVVLRDGRLKRVAPVLRFAAPLLPRRWAVRPKESSDIAGDEARRVHPLFPVPLRGMAELAALQQSVRALLPRVTQPALVLHGLLDRTCPVDNVEILRRELGSKQVLSRIFERSAHILTVDVEKAEVAAEVVRFVD
jgi:carboxylesterase